MHDEIMVSISCITYNHEKYIAGAIDSFIMQRTNFKYEILIHDDASTDRTAEIVREYESMYPGIIRAIYQTENQYSKGGRVSRFILDKAKGKYIAACEGDDYWADVNKLQKQVDYMESHPDCSLCVHGAYHVSADNKRLKSVSRACKKDKLFSAEEVIEGGGGLFPTNSFLYPSQYAVNRPDYYYKAPVGDYPLAIFLATQGTVYYIDRFMSAYRTGVAGSWSNTVLRSPKKIAAHFDQIATMLDAVDAETDYIYTEAIERTKKKNNFQVLLMRQEYNKIRSEEYKDIYCRLPMGTRAKIYCKQHFPRFTEGLKGLKNDLNIFVEKSIGGKHQ